MLDPGRLVMADPMRIMELETLNKFHYWRAILQRGQDKVLRKSKDPDGRALMLAESLPDPKKPHPHPPRTTASDAAIVAEASGSPSCLGASPTPISPATRTAVQSRRGSFLNFPPEIRNIVYQACVDYPTSRGLFDAYYLQRDKLRDNGKGKANQGAAGKERSRLHIQLHTPTILLLCRQITQEALSVLRTRLFVLDRIPPWVMGNDHPLQLSNFITKPTLQHLKYLELRIAFGEGISGSGRIWIKVIKELLKILSEGNNVINLKILIKLKHIDLWGLWFQELKYYEDLMNMFKTWECKHANRPGTIQYEHWVIDYHYAYSTGFRNPLVRFWPDPELWPGSILEYL